MLKFLKRKKWNRAQELFQALYEFNWEKWEKAGWTSKREAKRWYKIGFRDPFVALIYYKENWNPKIAIVDYTRDFLPNFCEWEAKGFALLEALEWRLDGFYLINGDEDAKEWKKYFEYLEAKRWHYYFESAKIAYKWYKAGFSPAKAGEYANNGITIEEALAKNLPKE